MKAPIHLPEAARAALARRTTDRCDRPLLVASEKIAHHRNAGVALELMTNVTGCRALDAASMMSLIAAAEPAIAQRLDDLGYRVDPWHRSTAPSAVAAAGYWFGFAGAEGDLRKFADVWREQAAIDHSFSGVYAPLAGMVASGRGHLALALAGANPEGLCRIASAAIKTLHLSVLKASLDAARAFPDDGVNPAVHALRLCCMWFIEPDLTQWAFDHAIADTDVPSQARAHNLAVAVAHLQARGLAFHWAALVTRCPQMFESACSSVLRVPLTSDSCASLLEPFPTASIERIHASLAEGDFDSAEWARSILESRKLADAVAAAPPHVYSGISMP